MMRARNKLRPLSTSFTLVIPCIISHREVPARVLRVDWGGVAVVGSSRELVHLEAFRRDNSGRVVEVRGVAELELEVALTFWLLWGEVGRSKVNVDAWCPSCQRRRINA